VQGTLDLLILRTLSLEPLHAYGVGLRLEQLSRGALRVNAGSLFPAFRRLERDGQIVGTWQAGRPCAGIHHPIAAGNY
jgi:PadR family transcriptional regulator PadR